MPGAERGDSSGSPPASGDVRPPAAFGGRPPAAPDPRRGPPGPGGQGYPGQWPGGDPRGQRGQGPQDGQRYPGPGQAHGGYGGGQAYNGRPRGGGLAYPEQGGFDRPGYPPPGRRPGQAANPGSIPSVPSVPSPPTAPNGAPNGPNGPNGRPYGGPAYGAAGYPGPAGPGYGDPPLAGYGGPAGPGYGDPQLAGYGGRPGPGRPERKVRFRRIRKVARLRSVRIVSALVAVFLIFVMVSAGQAAFKNNGQSLSSNLAEWARDHYLGPVVTFGEWLSYNPPKTGGKPSFSLAIPKNEQASPVNPVKKKAKGYVPAIPATLKSLAGSPLPGEGQWRVVEKVNGQPAIFTTFLRDATYTSYVNGIALMDQHLVKFQLHPGSEDPGPGNWGAWGSTYIAPGSRTGLLATFNGGFKLDSAGGGFYLNGEYHGSLVNGAASIVYYKNGTIKIGEWGRDFTMNSSIEGVRQNLKLLVDHGKVAADANSDVMSNWGATLGGGYYVWRSGLGITRDGRIVYVYGPALNAQDLGELLQRAGAVEGMQLDINPYWMKYEYYTVKGNPADPTPVNLLPTQQQSAYSYYSPYTRDFTAVYAR